MSSAPAAASASPANLRRSASAARDCSAWSSIVSRCRGLTGLGLHTSTLGEDAHDLVGGDAQGVADGETLDSALFAKAREMGARNAEELRCFGGGQWLAGRDGGNGLAACVGIDREQELLSHGRRQRIEIDLAAGRRIVGSVLEALALVGSEFGRVNDVHG